MLGLPFALLSDRIEREGSVSGMTFAQTEAVALVALTTIAFAVGRWRHDVIALVSLFASAGLGLVPETELFSGFGNPAVVTVVAVLLITHTIGSSGLVENAARFLADRSRGPASLVAALCGFGAFLSAFMNDIGALALVMPVAISAARRKRLSPSLVLMPLSFATLLGGTCTLIGTPANLIVSQLRSEAAWKPLGFFDLLPIGGPLTLAGLVWLSLVGWRTLKRPPVTGEPSAFDAGRYVTEMKIGERSSLEGRSVSEVEQAFGIEVHGIVRRGRRVFARRSERTFQRGDVLVLEAGAESLRGLATELGLGFSFDYDDRLSGKDAVVLEAVVMPTSIILGSTLTTIEPRERWGMDVLGITRQHQRIEGRLHDVPIGAGDVLLVRGRRNELMSSLAELGCLPLAPRDVLTDLRSAAPALGLFLGAIVLAATSLLSPQVAFSLAVLGLLILGRLELRTLPKSVDWSVIIMLAAMIPVGNALQTTGAADAIARNVLDLVGPGRPVLLLGATLATAIGITAFLNNATTAILLGPIAASISVQAGLSPDPFLIAVAIGASTDFLTPFGHHNNALVMGAGNYRFLDYGRVGAGLTAIVLVLGPVLIRLARGF